ncbi:MAG TPA: radical SAM protein [Terracidiphilus sp.]|nr:radical SAM protein [Terracidiphilus sp.]
MTEKLRPYLFYDVAISICSTCFRRVDAKIVFEDGKVWMLKRCPQHGHARVLVADDVDYYRRSREVFIKTPEQPMVYNTPIKYGCPYDCGLCPDHEQHSCLTLVEICDACNLTCPICYAGSGQHRTEFRTLEQIEAMLDCVVRNEKQPDVVQISGGEPTLHPDFFRVLEMCKERPIRHLMVNTNGIRIAQDEAFAERLATFMPQFEIYLQFDSLRREPLMQLRGADLRSIREKALERLNRHGISTTLVVTVERGVNDGELGAIVDFALTQPAVRGVTFQPVQQAGRVEGFNRAEHRMTLTEVRRRILDQTSVFKPEDIIPVPCHPDALAMAYAIKTGGKTIPLTGMLPPEVLIDGAKNTIVYEQEVGLRDHLFKLFATNQSPVGQASTLRELLGSLPRELLCCLPKVLLPKDLGYKNLFRVLIVQFIDADAFDVRSVKKSCIHIAHPDGKRIIPFDTFNMFYRGELETTRLAALRGAEDGQRIEV